MQMLLDHSILVVAAKVILNEIRITFAQDPKPLDGIPLHLGQCMACEVLQSGRCLPVAYLPPFYQFFPLLTFTPASLLFLQLIKPVPISRPFFLLSLACPPPPTPPPPTTWLGFLLQNFKS